MLSDFGMAIGAIVVLAFVIGIWTGRGLGKRETEDGFARRQRANAQHDNCANHHSEIT